MTSKFGLLNFIPFLFFQVPMFYLQLQDHQLFIIIQCFSIKYQSYHNDGKFLAFALFSQDWLIAETSHQARSALKQSLLLFSLQEQESLRILSTMK
jgi:hypothetical protein